jgi:hypothetical protein
MRKYRSIKSLWSPWPWTAFGLAFYILSTLNNDGPRPLLQFIDTALYALMIIGLLRNHGTGFNIKLPRRVAPVAFIALSWAFGMIYEASLTVDGKGIGGIHPDTLSSYILAQGDYIMIAVATLLVIRHFHLGFREVFFFAAGISLTEGLIFTGVLSGILLSLNVYMAPLFLAYYTLAYASYVALPLLIIAPEQLWTAQRREKTISIPLLWLLGAALAFVIRVIWGLGWIPFATWAFNLPPNLPGM